MLDGFDVSELRQAPDFNAHSAEMDAFVDDVVAVHSADLVASEGLTEAEAEARSRAQTDAMLRGCGETHGVFLLTHRASGTVAARAWLDLGDGERRKRAFLFHLAVAEPFRRRGLARALLGHVENAARERGADRLELAAAASNTAALALYGERGFETFSVRMAKSL